MDARLAVVVAVAAAALLVSVAFAHVVSYYPVSVTLAPQNPKVVFDLGSNAGGTDITGGTISVTLGPSAANLTIEVHPTYETTYYENITVIKNTDKSKSYSVSIVVNTPMTLPAGSQAKLIVYSKGATRTLSGWPVPSPSNPLLTVNLKSSGKYGPVTISAGGVLEVDLLVYIPEDSGVAGNTYTATVFLTVTP